MQALHRLTSLLAIFAFLLIITKTHAQDTQPANGQELVGTPMDMGPQGSIMSILSDPAIGYSSLGADDDTRAWKHTQEVLIPDINDHLKNGESIWPFTILNGKVYMVKLITQQASCFLTNSFNVVPDFNCSAPSDDGVTAGTPIISEHLSAPSGWYGCYYTLPMNCDLHLDQPGMVSIGFRIPYIVTKDIADCGMATVIKGKPSDQMLTGNVTQSIEGGMWIWTIVLPHDYFQIGDSIHMTCLYASAGFVVTELP